MIRSTLAFAATFALAACASPRATSTTTLTAAEAQATEPTAHEPASEAAPAPSAAAVEAPPLATAQRVCRTKDAFGVTTELYLEWNGATAKGVLRSTAPSGMITERRVHGERYNDAIVLDDPGQTDLVTHAAVVRTHAGKQHIRLGDAGDAWSSCD